VKIVYSKDSEEKYGNEFEVTKLNCGASIISSPAGPI